LNTVNLKVAEQVKKIAVLGEIRLFILIKKELNSEVQDIAFSQQTSGRLGGVSGNKGGLVVTFRIGETRFCFLNSHLNAHTEFMERRNEDIKAIISGLHRPIPNFESINSHYCFFLGDLNYRIEMEHEEVLELVQQKNWERLLFKDQLKDQQTKGKALSGFSEADISFPPTFKVKKTVDPQYSTQRVPSYCDRVLWKAYPCLHLRCLKYQSIPEIITSDHKPVHGIFEVEYISTKSLQIAENVKQIILTNLTAQNLPTDSLNQPQFQLRACLVHGSTKSTATTKSQSKPFWFESLKIDTQNLQINLFPHTYLLLAISCVADGQTIKLGESVLPLSKVQKIPSDFKIDLFQEGLPFGVLVGKAQFII